MGDLNALLRAKSIAIVGASANPDKFGWHVVRQLIAFGYGGRILPINPGYSSIEGLPCFPNLVSVPGEIDLAAICVGDEAAESALSEAARRGIKAAVVFGTGASQSKAGNPGSERLAAVARDADMALMGANCMGFYNFVDRLFVTGYPYHREPHPGVISFITHSGSTLSSVAKNTRGMNFNYVISPGQELVLSAADYLRFVLDQAETRVVGLFLETVRDPDAFVGALANAQALAIPVVLLKVGRSERGAEMTMAHTGALAGRHAAIEAVADRYGVTMVRTLEEMLDTLELFASGRWPTTRALGAITDSGGERGMMVDLAADLGVPFATLSRETMDAMTTYLNPGLTAANPADLWGSGRGWQRSYRSCIAAMLADDAVGAFNFGIDFNVGSRLGPDYREIAIEAFRGTSKPFAVVSNVAAGLNPIDAAELRRAGLPVLEGAENGLLAFRHLFNYGDFSGQPICSRPDAIDIPAAAVPLLQVDRPLTEFESLSVLGLCGLSCVRSTPAEDREAAVGAARDIGYPVVLKTGAPGVMHKSDRGGVWLHLQSDKAVGAAYRSLHASFGPQALIQPHIDTSNGVELLLGMKVDSQFGPLVTVGLGGIWVELLRDTVTLLAPCSGSDAVRRLRDLRGFELMTGKRGRSAVDLGALGQLIERFSIVAIAVAPYVAEIDINPVLAVGNRFTVLDALIVPYLSMQSQGSSPV